ncbi:MAG: patatin-like phospholipase family protein [Bacteroidales bacterium]|nr:patatin-like phospholipase family protein [Bacteroidales bacterium]
MNILDIIANKPYKLGIALSGGGIKGLCHAGVLKALEEQGIKPDILSGVSAGSIVGALYADGYTPDEIAKLFEDISFRQMTKFRIPDGGLFRIDAFEDFMFRNLRAKTFEELNIPLRVVATNLDKGQSVVFEKGNLIDPIVASCSVPVLFIPKKINGVYYVDGGVLKNFPVSTIRNECDKVIGINASPLVADEYKLSLLNVASRTYHFMFKANIIHDKELCDLLIEPVDMGNYDTFDIDKGREIFELGYKSTKQLLESKMKVIG